MNHAHRAGVAAMLAVCVTFAGCKSKQEKPAAAPQEKSAAAPASTRADAQSATSQDLADARGAALRVLSQIEKGDFPLIYRESGAGFKQIGPESAFVGKFQQTFQKTGPLGKPRELKSDTRPDNTIVLLYRIENQRFVSELRLTFQRARSGVMELVGLNQHDEPRKQ